ncbi:hypothetical protein AB6N23_12040 [Cellulomonas sp. 179-A 9B4 NHS]
MAFSTVIAVLAVAVLAVVLVAALARTVRDDGLGHRPPPPVRPTSPGDPW